MFLTRYNAKRNINLDIIRTVAVFSVLSVHFFLNTDFYNTPILGKKLYAATIIRTGFMVCVPLFLVLTGYLMNKKKLSKAYYSGIKKTIIIYILSTLCIIAFHAIVLNERFTLFDVLINITSFKQYSWYIEMYIGLFLLIPFLNLIYNNLSGKKEKLILILTLLTLTTLPSLLNTFDFTASHWLFNPASSVNYQKLVPAWWVNLYPLTYYFTGAFIQEYQDDFRMPLKRNFMLFCVSVILMGSYSYYRSYNSNFIWGSWCSWGGFENVITTVLLFIFLLRIKTEKMPYIIKQCFFTISELSLGIYLVSWIFDQYNYPKLNQLIPEAADRLLYYFLIVPLNFLLSLVLSWLINLIYTALNKLLITLTRKA